MKKAIILFAALIFAFTTNHYAQFRLGLTPVTGLNFNIHSGSDLQESGNGFGLFLGAQADMSFTESIGLLAGLVFYDNRSGSYSESGTDYYYGQYNADVNVSLAYFQIEALFKYKLPSKLYFVFGPELGFNEESEAEIEINWTNYGSQKGKSTLKNTQTRFELKMGAGYEIPISKKLDIVPQLTFGYGLTNVIEDVKWKILTFQALVGLKFNVL